MSFTNSHLEELLKDRPLVEGVTIDGDNTRNHDDAFMIMPQADGSTVVEVSVSDAPALVHAQSQMDLDAQRLMRDVFHEGRKLASMLPLSLVHEFLSLNEEKLHPAVTFRIKLDKDMNVTDVDISRTKFRNLRRVKLSQVDESVAHGEKIPNMWLGVARSLYSKRQNEMMQAVSYNIPEKMKTAKAIDPMIQPDAEGAGEFIVHEIMRLTNEVATKYMQDNKLPMAKVTQEPSIRERFKKGSAQFDTKAQATMKSVEKKLVDMSAHVKVTSPSRSYVDLINLRTIVAHVDGKPAPHTAREMQDAAAKDKKLAVHFKCASEQCRSVEEIQEALAELVAGRIEAIAQYQMQTVTAFQSQVEKAYYASLGQGDREVRNHAPRSDNFDILSRQIRGGRAPQFTVNAVRLGGTKMFFAMLQTEDGSGRRVVNVTGAGVSPNEAIDQAAAATLIHMGGGKSKPGR